MDIKLKYNSSQNFLSLERSGKTPDLPKVFFRTVCLCWRVFPPSCHGDNWHKDVRENHLNGDTDNLLEVLTLPHFANLKDNDKILILPKQQEQGVVLNNYQISLLVVFPWFSK